MLCVRYFHVFLFHIFFSESFLLRFPSHTVEVPSARRPSGPLVGRTARVDLLPKVALERLGIHNELCALKWGGAADGWLRGGFQVPGESVFENFRCNADVEGSRLGPGTGPLGRRAETKR